MIYLRPVLRVYLYTCTMTAQATRSASRLPEVILVVCLGVPSR